MDRSGRTATETEKHRLWVLHGICRVAVFWRSFKGNKGLQAKMRLRGCFPQRLFHTMQHMNPFRTRPSRYFQILFQGWRDAANVKQKAAAQAAFKMCKAVRLHTASAMLWAPEIVSLVRGDVSMSNLLHPHRLDYVCFVAIYHGSNHLHQFDPVRITHGVAGRGVSNEQMHNVDSIAIGTSL